MVTWVVKALILFAVALGSAAVSFVVALDRHSKTPHAWATAILFVLFSAAFVSSRNRVARLWWWNCSVIALLWVLVDGVAALLAGERIVPVRPRFLIAFGLAEYLPQGLDQHEPYLGKRNAPNAREQIGALTQSTDAYGLRVSPPPVEGVEPESCALFFGCSYTFGDGVSDVESFAYRVEVRSLGQIRSRNFGVGGGAPHYALAQLRSGVVATGAQCQPTHAFFLLIPHHALRSAGKSIVRQGPRFVLSGDGQVVESGSLNRTPLAYVRDVFLYTSALYVTARGYDDPLADEDFRLVAALLNTLGTELGGSYPGIKFHVLHWDDPPVTALDRELATLPFPVHKISSIIPKLSAPNEPAYLPDDHHPNVWAHDKIAQYVVEEVIAPRAPGVHAAARGSGALARPGL